jgi:phage tail sheath protein FI
MPFALSPGVTVVEKDFTSIVPSVATSIGAFAGEFQWGPVLYPVTVSSENVLVQLFGKPNDETAQSFFTAANFLAYSNNLKCVRVDSNLARNAVAAQSGTVTSMTLVTGGSGYTSTPLVEVGAPNVTGGTQAIITTVVTDNSVTGFIIGTAGSGYTSVPAITIGTSWSASAGVTLGQQIAHLTNLYTVTTSGNLDPTTAPTHASVITTTGAFVPTTQYTITLVGDTDFTLIGAASNAVGVIFTASGVGGGTTGTARPSVDNGSAKLKWAGLRATATSSITVGGVKIKNADDYEQNWSSGQGVIGAFAAKYPGTYGNAIKISSADNSTFSTWEYKTSFPSAPGTSAAAARVGGSKDELHMVVVEIQGAVEVVLETYSFLSKASDAKKKDGSNSYYKTVINNSSKYVWWTDHPVAGTNWGTTATGTTFADLDGGDDTITLTGGVDDFAATQGNFTAGFDLFLNSEEIDVSLIMMGKASVATAGYVISNIAEVRKDCVVCISPEDTITTDPIIGTGSAAAAKVVAYHTALLAAGGESSYAVLDSGYKYQYDRYNDVYRWIPLNGDIAGLCARTDNTNDPWFSPGGMSRGQIKNAIKLSFNPGKTERDTLYNIGVNPVVSFPGSGTVLYGDKTLLTRPSAFDRINVRRLFIILEKSIAIAAKAQLFEFNDSFTRAQFKNLVEPYLRDVEGRRGITDFRVVCDETNNTGEVIDRNEFVADIYIKPARSINFITLNFIAARTGISFEEIGA